MMTDRAQILLGRIWIDVVSFADALRTIARLVDRGRGGTVFTPNVDHIVRAERNDAFCRAYAEADLALADGTPVVWAASLLGTPVPEKVSGSDLMIPLARHAAARGWRLYLLGGGPGIAARAAERLRAEHGTTVVGVDAPRVSDDGVADDERAVIERIRRAAPHILLVGLGAPKQELWMARARGDVAPAVVIAVGAGLDFVAGAQGRAPRWMSWAGLEWCYRLAREPRRLWRRYLVDDPPFVGLVLRMLRIPRPARTRLLRADA